jgi:uncharacterized protein
MTDVPRSRALVRLDGPGHILPIEPVTPEGSQVWRVMHFPVVLAGVAVGLLALAALAIQLLGHGLAGIGYVPGARYLVPVIAAAAMTGVYLLFVRSVERRRSVEELGRDGAMQEVGLALAGGLALAALTYAVLLLLGAITIDGVNPVRTMAVPIVVEICTAICLELVLRGLLFRLLERLVGSWLALVTSVLFFAAGLPFGAYPSEFAALSAVLQSGLLFALAFMATRRLWAAIGIHAGWNLGQVALYGTAVSLNGAYGLVLTRVAGPDWLTGGIAGTAASLPALIVTGVAILALLVAVLRRGRVVRPLWQQGRAGRAASSR